MLHLGFKGIITDNKNKMLWNSEATFNFDILSFFLNSTVAKIAEKIFRYSYIFPQRTGTNLQLVVQIN
jgi:hypothetical protein